MVHCQCYIYVHFMVFPMKYPGYKFLELSRNFITQSKYVFLTLNLLCKKCKKFKFAYQMVLEPRSNWSSVSVSNLTTSRRKSVIAMTRSQGKGAARRPSYYEMPTYSRTGSSTSHSYDSQFLSTSSLGVITGQQVLILFLCFSFYQVSGGRTSQGMLDVPGIQDRRASETQVRLDF